MLGFDFHILFNRIRESGSAGNWLQQSLVFAVMGMFTNLMSKIFGHAPASASSGATAPNATVASGTPSAPTTAPTGTFGTPSTPATTPAPIAASAAPVSEPAKVVDVTAILDSLAAKNPEKLDWRKSIVDLMKLVGIESSLSARKQLAVELHYSGDENDSAAMNVWLHKEVIKKLSENGGKVPQELL